MEKRLRALCERNTPPFDEDAFMDRLCIRASESRSRASLPKRRSGLRLVIYACMAVILMAAVTVGGLELNAYLSRDSQIIVFTDDSFGPAGDYQTADTGSSDQSIPADLTIRTMIPGGILYQAQKYTHTEVRVGLQRLPPDNPPTPENRPAPESPETQPTPENLTYAGKALAAAEPASPTDSPAEDRPTDYGYEVYTIAGVDSLQAIAVKFVARSLSDEDELFFVWIKYEHKMTTTPSTLADDATAQAETTLREFFQAWTTKDPTAYEALLTERRREEMHLGDEMFAGCDRMEFGPIVAAPEVMEYRMAWYGHPYRSDRGDIAQDDVRCFRASITWYYKPGIVGPTESGEELPWMWWLVRDTDGNWGVDGWGA